MVRLSVIFSILFLFSQATYADPFPRASGKADNKVHFVCWDQPGTAPSELVSYLNYLNTIVYSQVGVYAYPWPCAPLVDAVYTDLLISPILLGATVCTNFSAGICIENDVFVNKAKINAEAASQGMAATDVLEANWCHETGHSFGLTHSAPNASNCMKQGWHTNKIHSSHQVLTHLSTL